MKAFLSIAAALSGLLAAAPAIAQGTYPDRTIRIFVGFPAGGPPDIAARLLAERFSASWGKSVVVENATGSGGNIAVERAVKSTPDGYTLLMASNAIAINPSLYPTLPYNAMKDLVPISLAVIMPVILVVNNDVPAKTAREFAALARAQPGKLIVGHAGVGTPAHLAGELFKSVNERRTFSRSPIAASRRCCRICWPAASPRRSPTSRWCCSWCRTASCARWRSHRGGGRRRCPTCRP